MASRTLPGLGLKGDWDLGEDGWKDEMDANLRTISVLLGGNVLSIVSATPGSPTEGDRHIFDDTHATQPNKIAVFDEGAWVYLTPVEGVILYNLADDTRYEFVGGAWGEFSAGAGSTGAVVMTDADDYTVLAADNTKYIRLTGAAAKSITVQDEVDQALPTNGEWHFRNVGAGDATFVEDTSVTINPPIGGTLVVAQGGTVTLKRVAEDEFDLIGVTVAA